MTLIVDVSGDESKIQCCEEQYCIGTWTVRSMNQGKMEVVKQEMARVNIEILGISELKWIAMGEFNSDDHYIYYCGQESLRRRKWQPAPLLLPGKSHGLRSLVSYSPWGHKESDMME